MYSLAAGRPRTALASWYSVPSSVKVKGDWHETSLTGNAWGYGMINGKESSRCRRYVTQATAFNVLRTSFPRHSSGIMPTLALPCPRLRGHCQLHFAL